MSRYLVVPLIDSVAICSSPSTNESQSSASIGTASTFQTYVDELYLQASVACNRRLFCTVDGRLGLGPDIVHEGDAVAIAHGSRTPLVLRTTGTGEYWLVGQCYLEDSMYGELCTWKETDADEMVLV